MKKPFILLIFLFIAFTCWVSAQTSEEKTQRQQAAEAEHENWQALKKAIFDKSLTDKADEARKELKQLVKARADSDYWYLRYGDLLFQMAIKQMENHQYDEGMETAGQCKAAYEKGIGKVSRKNPKRKANALAKLANVQDRFFGDKAAAGENLKEAEKLDADNAEVRKRLAKVQAKLSTTEE